MTQRASGKSRSYQEDACPTVNEEGQVQDLNLKLVTLRQVASPPQPVNNKVPLGKQEDASGALTLKKTYLAAEDARRT